MNVSLSNPAPATTCLPAAGFRTPAAAPRVVQLVVAGARGQVGSALCAQLARERSALREALDLDLRIAIGFDRHGLARAGRDGSIGAQDHYAPRREGDVAAVLDALARRGSAATLVVDCTASEEIADLYAPLLSAGVGVVAANKHANSRSHAAWRHLQDCARRGRAPWRYETNVGAAIPVLGPLRDLRLRGERVLALDGLLSGSLAHVLSRMHAGVAFSGAVQEARRLGYTEPDPLEDLCARDLARKALVLGRECGFDLEPAAVRVTPLVDAALAARVGLDAALAAEDATWRARIDDAHAAGERWVMLVHVDAGGASIGPARVGAGSAFAALPAGQNLLHVRTPLQDATPLVLGGPGAGPAVTAAGVLSDILVAACELASRR
jgi:aspartokinase/homoserine dehydrogenase 1